MRARPRSRWYIDFVAHLHRLAWIVLASCSPNLVHVAPDGVEPPLTASDRTFEVDVHAAGARDPLPVSGASVSFVDLSPSLGQAIVRSVRPVHDASLTVELVSADATYAHARLDVSLVVRATLRMRQGNAFVAQTQVVCRESGVVAPERGAPVVWACMAHLARDLGGWLEGLPKQ